MLSYQALQPVKDAPVIAVMRELSAQYPRFGYRRIGVYLERAGHVMSWDRTHRLWKLAGLQAEGLTAENIASLARDHDPFARQIFQRMGKLLGLAVANLISLFDPQVVIVSGGLSGAAAF